ncbi:HAD family hydrolase [Corallococcus coralloides]|uniref:HAD family hydrolase n=1 Tax=Corallococcus coralloides TaxID=184914 RepID=A0A410RJZ3_CORCK|nr:HAD family hydrolase [Corallococcus coralloides]
MTCRPIRPLNAHEELATASPDELQLDLERLLHHLPPLV